MYKKRPDIPPEPETFFGRELKRLMAASESIKSIRDVAIEFEITYEYARRLIRGINIPSKLLVQEVARRFRVDPITLETLASRDRLVREGISESVIEMNEDHRLFQDAMNALSESQREMLRKQMDRIIKSERSQKSQEA